MNLLSLLACPYCKERLTKAGNQLHCSECKRRYAIKQGIPVLVDLNHLPEHLRGQIRYFTRATEGLPKNHTLAQWQSKYVNRLKAVLKGYRGKVIIDNACGSGYIALEAVQNGAFVIACDLNLPSLVRLRGIARKMGIDRNLLTVCCSAEDLPFQPAVADAVVANAILEHLPRERDAIADIGRVARKGAIAFITVPLAYHLLNPMFLPVNFIHDKQIGHLRRYTRDMLVERFQDWSVVDIFYSGHTAKVFMTLVNIVWRIFSEHVIEKMDEKQSKRPLFASNISMIFRKTR